jgi:putative membrane protein
MSDQSKQYDEKDNSKIRKTMEAILHSDRLSQLQAFDARLVDYEPYSFQVIFRIRGRNLGMLILPLLLLATLDMGWWFLLDRFLLVQFDLQNGELSEETRDRIEQLDKLISPILVPVSFLMVFRLGRAAIRFWDARKAVGSLVERSRSMISTAVIGCQGNVEMVNQFALWICVYPITVKNFLRPESPGQSEVCCKSKPTSSHKYTGAGTVFGDLLTADEAEALIKSPCQPIFVLNKLRALVWNIDNGEPSEGSLKQALLYRHLNGQVDSLTAAWGAMERINGTPLPFVYVVHLRTFLMLYLSVWHLASIALNGWFSIFPLLIASWGLLGIEAAAVECERPFHWNKNHLALGKMCIAVASNVHQTLENCGY